MDCRILLKIIVIIIILTVFLNKVLIYREPFEDIYDYKVSVVFKKMFEQPSIWLGYQEFDPNYQTEKLYVKNSVSEEKNI